MSTGAPQPTPIYQQQPTPHQPVVRLLKFSIEKNFVGILDRTGEYTDTSVFSSTKYTTNESICTISTTSTN
jgi:hypothetical protein